MYATTHLYYVTTHLCMHACVTEPCNQPSPYTITSACIASNCVSVNTGGIVLKGFRQNVHNSTVSSRVREGWVLRVGWTMRVDMKVRMV